MTLGPWRRAAVENIPNEQLPSDIKSMGLKRGRRAFYQAGSRVQVIVYEMNAQAVAFELQQKWRNEPGRVAYHQGPYFVILEGGDATEQRSLMEALEEVLKR